MAEMAEIGQNGLKMVKNDNFWGCTVGGQIGAETSYLMCMRVSEVIYACFGVIYFLAAS